MIKILANRPFLKRFLISYLVVLLIPFGLTIITFRTSMAVVEDYADKSNSTLISQVRFALDERLNALENLVFQISQNRKMDSLSKQERPVSPDFHIKLIEAMKEINTFMMLQNNIATDYYIIFLNNQYVLDGSTIIPFDLFFEYKYKYADWGKQEWIDYLSSSYHRASFLKSDQIFSSNETFMGIPFVKTIPFYFNSTNTAFILFNIRESDLFSYYYPGEQALKGVPALYNSKTFEKIADAPLDEDEDYIWMKSDSDKYDLLYELNVPYKEVYEKLLLVKTVMLVINILVFVLGCVAAVFFARLNANPIYSIYNMVRNSKPDSGNAHKSYEFLNSSITQLITDNRSLESIVEEHKRIISEEFYYRLVKYGYRVPSEMESIRQYLDRPLPGGLCGVLLFNIPSDQFLETESIYGEIVQIKINLIKQFKEVSTFPDRWLDLDTLSIGYVFSIRGSEKEQWFDEARKEITRLTNNLDGSVDVPCYWSMGNPILDLFNLNTSYGQARIIADEIPDPEPREIYEYRNFPPVNNNFNLPMDIMQKLINLGKSGESELAIELFRENWDENINEKSLSKRSRQIYFLELRSLLVRISPAMADEPDFFEFHLKSPETIYDLVIHILQKLGDGIKQDSQKSQDELKSRLIQYVKENFQDKNISLSSIADDFDKSESYISHFFKKYCDVNFYSLLESLRMERAQELLSQTSLSISEISESVGYSSMHSFRRAFKKVYGVSPSSFREI